jgi:hypothetical protein
MREKIDKCLLPLCIVKAEVHIGNKKSIRHSCHSLLEFCIKPSAMIGQEVLYPSMPGTVRFRQTAINRVPCGSILFKFFKIVFIGFKPAGIFKQ